jgi:hypothetical protein
MQCAAFQLFYGTPKRGCARERKSGSQQTPRWRERDSNPRSPSAGVRLYREILDQIAWGENNGFDDVWLSEHHAAIAAAAGRIEGR